MKKEAWHVSDTIYNKRIAICNSCINLTESRACSICNCLMDTKATADWFGCPINKWPAESK
jgi:hypothetical protein